MLTLAAYLHLENISGSAFAHRLSQRLDQKVQVQSVWRWTRESHHSAYCIPSPAAVVAIYFETSGKVSIESWYTHLVNRMAKTKRPITPPVTPAPPAQAPPTLPT